MTRRCRLLSLSLSLLSLAACRDLSARRNDRPDAGGGGGMSRVPARGTATTLDIASWNIEWLGDTSHGPTNEALQLSNARDVIGGTDFDLWGVAEIANTRAISTNVGRIKLSANAYQRIL